MKQKNKNSRFLVGKITYLRQKKTYVNERDYIDIMIDTGFVTCRLWDFMMLSKELSIGDQVQIEFDGQVKEGFLLQIKKLAG